MLCKFAVRAEHVKDVLRNGILGPWIVDDQGMSVKVVHFRKVGIASDGRELCHKVNALEQSLVDILSVRVGSVIVK